MRGIMKVIPFVIAAAAAGCYTSADVGYGGGAYVGPAPALVYAAPGVQVIADYDEPIFFSDGLYWRSYGGVWYSSRVYNGGWAASYNVPYGVRGIREPGAYAHYRPAGYAGPRYRGGAYNGGAAVRDHRTYSAPAPAYRAPARGPVVRDHRR